MKKWSNEMIGKRIIVKGKIGTVRWLEDAPYHARKERGDKGYFQYVLEVMDVDAADTLMRTLEGTQQAYLHRDDSMAVKTGVWTEEWPIYGDADDAAEEAAYQADRTARTAAETMPAAFERAAAAMRKRGENPTVSEVESFIREQLYDLDQRMQRRGWNAEISEFRRMYVELKSALLTEQFAALYERHAERIRVLAQKYR